MVCFEGDNLVVLHYCILYNRYHLMFYDCQTISLTCRPVFTIIQKCGYQFGGRLQWALNFVTFRSSSHWWDSVSFIPPYTQDSNSLVKKHNTIYPALIQYEQSNCIDWINFYYTVRQKYSFPGTVWNGNSISTDVIEDTLENDKKSLVSAVLL